jgi:hypothetical protein
MARKPKKWPDYALNSLEGTLLHLKTIERLSRAVQVAAKAGDQSEVIILAGDVRERSQDAVHLLVQARTGEYELEHNTTAAAA